MISVPKERLQSEAFQFHRVGQWLREPKQPARRSRILDGVFGYTGIRFVPKRSAEASVRWVGEGARSSEPREVTLQVRLAAEAKLLVSFGSQTFELTPDWLKHATHRADLNLEKAPEGFKSKNQSNVKVLSVDQVGPTTWVRFGLERATRMRLKRVKGLIEVFGAIWEYQKPGAVLDTAGINGARVATPLAWEESQHIAQVKKRQPDLIVLSYGTNEVFDQTPLRRYPEQYERLLKRLRIAAPDASCWKNGPTDAAEPNGTSKPRVLSITALQRKLAERFHCGFSSPAELMGGEGAFQRWMMSRPRLASGDRVHLTVAGYHKLGDLLADELLPR